MKLHSDWADPGVCVSVLKWLQKSVSVHLILNIAIRRESKSLFRNYLFLMCFTLSPRQNSFLFNSPLRKQHFIKGKSSVGRVFLLSVALCFVCYIFLFTLKSDNCKLLQKFILYYWWNRKSGCVYCDKHQTKTPNGYMPTEKYFPQVFRKMNRHYSFSLFPKLRQEGSARQILLAGVYNCGYCENNC
jgi:hypothetical protein